MSVLTLLQVAAGGALGSVLRHLLGRAVSHGLGASFPWGTLVCNVLGGFAMGVLAVVLLQWGASRAAPFLTVGLLGGFTTFSSFSLDAVTLWERGREVAAAGYVAGSVVLSIVALLAGLALARAALQ